MSKEERKIGMADFRSFLQRRFKFDDEYVNMPMQSVKHCLMRADKDVERLKDMQPAYKYVALYAEDLGRPIQQVVNELTDDFVNSEKRVVKDMVDALLSAGQQTAKTADNQRQEQSKNYVERYRQVAVSEILNIKSKLADEDYEKLMDEFAAYMKGYGYKDSTATTYLYAIIKLLNASNEAIASGSVAVGTAGYGAVLAFKRFLIATGRLAEEDKEQQTTDQVQVDVQILESLDKRINEVLHRMLLENKPVSKDELNSLVSEGRSVVETIKSRLGVLTKKLRYLELAMED